MKSLIFLGVYSSKSLHCHPISNQTSPFLSPAQCQDREFCPIQPSRLHLFLCHLSPGYLIPLHVWELINSSDPGSSGVFGDAAPPPSVAGLFQGDFHCSLPGSSYSPLNQLGFWAVLCNFGGRKASLRVCGSFEGLG